MADDTETFMIEDAQIVFRNFAGKEAPFNAAGKRNFSAILDPDTAAAMAKDGWNVKQLKEREEDVEGDFYIPVEVSFKIRPPRVVLITSKSRTTLTEANVEILDFADIRTVDFIARAYDWSVQDKTGRKAYLQTMFVTIEEDALEQKYAIEDEER